MKAIKIFLFCALIGILVSQNFVGLTKIKAINSNTTSDKCPPSYLEANFSAQNASGDPMVYVLWNLPTQVTGTGDNLDASACTSNNTKPAINNLYWHLNIWEVDPNTGKQTNHVWGGTDYETITQKQQQFTNEMQWGKSYQLIMDFMWNNNGSYERLGRRTRSFDMPKEAPHPDEGAGTGSCYVYDLKAYVETMKYGDLHRVHFSWKYNMGKTPTGDGCPQTIKVKAPSGREFRNPPSRYETTWTDLNPTSGTYTFFTMSAYDELGSRSVKVDLTTTPGTGDPNDPNNPNNPKNPNNPNNPGPGSDLCKSKCSEGTLQHIIAPVSSAIKEAICDAQCTVIDWMANLISTVINSVLFPTLGI